MQRVTVIQQGGSGEAKIRWLQQHSFGFELVQVLDLPDNLPVLIDEPNHYIPEIKETDLLITFVKQPDILDELANWCRQRGLVLVASGRRLTGKKVFCPPICCALKSSDYLGEYGKRYGSPVLSAKVKDGRLQKIQVLRGAPCGASWRAARKVIGMQLDVGITRFGLEVQLHCTAGSADWDPLWGSSPVHTAAKVHVKALERAIDTEVQ